MSSYFSDLIDGTPVEREITIGGKTKPVWVKRLTAGQRMKLQAGQVYEFKDGVATSKMDLGDSKKRTARLVQFAICDRDGKPIFRQEQEVLDLDERLMEKLAAVADEVVNAGEEPGKG